MKRSLRAWLAIALLLAAGCARHKSAPTRRLPVGDGIWFEDGLGESGVEAETAMVRAGISWVFYPICRVGYTQGWSASPAPPPPRPFARLPVFLVVASDESATGAFQRGDSSIAGLDNAIWTAVQAAIQNGGRYGTIGGIHLDLPFAAADEAAYAKLVSGLRKKIPPTILLSLSLRFAPASPPSDELQALLQNCDGLVAFVAGIGALADPVATDNLEKSWWAGFSPAARGTWTTAGGEDRGPLPELVLVRLSNDTRMKFLQDLALKETLDGSFTLVPREAVSLPGYSFHAGDRLNFHQPVPSDILYELGADVAGRRFVRGRVLCLSGRSEADRIFTLEAFSEVLAGKPSLVALHVSAEAGKGSVDVDAENTSPHPSIMSATANWVEVEIPSGGIREVQTGGFDRFEVFGADRSAVTLGRATAVRFYETLVGGHEKIDRARILLRGAVPQDCCTVHYHVLSASGQEVTSEAPVPTPGKR
jgi:hypothetical protein